MRVYFDEAYERQVREGRMTTAHDLGEVIKKGIVQRVRPKMMAVAAIMGGLLPIMWTTGTSRMTKKSASFVLALLRGSTYRTEPLGCRNHWRGFFVRQDSFKGRTAHTKCGTYLLASSLVAALLDDLFEHPTMVVSSCPRRAGHRSSAVSKWFFRSLLVPM